MDFSPKSGVGSRGGITITLASNLKSVSIDYRKAVKHLVTLPQYVANEVNNEALRLAIKYSSGPGKPKGYYSLRYPPKATDYIINIKSGRMVSSWQKRPPRKEGNSMILGLYNTARSDRGFNYPLALFTGTVKMRKRPLPQKVYEDMTKFIDAAARAHTRQVTERFVGKRGLSTAGLESFTSGIEQALNG